MTLVVQVPDRLKPGAKELLRQFDEITGDTLNAAKNSVNPDDGSEPRDKDGKGGKKKKFWQ